MVAKKKANRKLKTLAAKSVSAKKANSVKGGIDKASLKLYEAACKGTHMKEVVIEL